MRLSVNVSFSYGSRKVLKDVAFSAGRGELIAVIGPNGAGKSTLLKCISGILKPEGRVELDSLDVLSLPPRERARLIAYVPQSSYPEFNFTVREFVEMGTYFTGGNVDEALAKVGMLERGGDSIMKLSGGEYQLVMIARALAQNPRVMLLDEPTSHLDINHALSVMELLSSLKKEKIMITVLHDLDLAIRYADRVMILSSGRKIWDGSVGDLTPKILERVYGSRFEFVEGKLGRGLIAALDSKPLNPL
ncbi:ABC transporter ATP-binding protein [Thermococcus sp.]